MNENPFSWPAGYSPNCLSQYKGLHSLRPHTHAVIPSPIPKMSLKLQPCSISPLSQIRKTGLWGAFLDLFPFLHLENSSFQLSRQQTPTSLVIVTSGVLHLWGFLGKVKGDPAACPLHIVSNPGKSTSLCVHTGLNSPQEVPVLACRFPFELLYVRCLIPLSSSSTPAQSRSSGSAQMSLLISHVL